MKEKQSLNNEIKTLKTEKTHLLHKLSTEKFYHKRQTLNQRQYLDSYKLEMQNENEFLMKQFKEMEKISKHNN